MVIYHGEKYTIIFKIKSKDFNIPTLLILTLKFDMVQPENHSLEKRSVPFENPSLSGIMLNSGFYNQQTWDYQNYHQQQHPATSKRPSHSSSHVMFFSLSFVACREVFGVKINGGLCVFSIQNAPPFQREALKNAGRGGRIFLSGKK